MGLTMKKILEKNDSCNIFSLTKPIFKYDVSITKEEFDKALIKIEKHLKEEIKKYYNEEEFINYPSFEELYSEVKQECYDFVTEDNKRYYINKFFNKKEIELLKNDGFKEKDIVKMKEDFFSCSLITDLVGEKTKYGKEHQGFF